MRLIKKLVLLVFLIGGAAQLQARAADPNCLYAKCVQADSLIIIDLINASEDTLFLFSSYLDDRYVASKFLHKVNRKDRVYKISFLPILPYLGVTVSDVVVLGENKIGTRFQMVYDFIVLPPKAAYRFKVSRAALFKNLNEKENAIIDYNPYARNKYDRKTDFDVITLESLDGYQLTFEFAYYQDTSLLRDRAAYYTNEFDYNRQAKSFRIVSLPITLPK